MGVTIARVSQIEEGDVISVGVIAGYVGALGGGADGAPPRYPHRRDRG
jgi:hypothetical protein